MKKTNNSIKRITSVFVALMLVFTVLPTAAFAANSNGIESMDISIGSKTYNYNRKVINQFFAFNFKDNATYSVKVSDTSVLTAVIEKHPDLDSINDMKVVNLTGLKAGTSTVSVYETIGGKTSCINTTTVNVKDSYLTATGNYSHVYGLGGYDTELKIANFKFDAEYTFDVSSDGIKVYLGYANSIICESTKLGDYTLTITEKHNGVSKVFQTVTIHVAPMTVKPEYTLYNGDGTLDRNLISNMDTNYKYLFTSDGLDINIVTDIRLSNKSFEGAVNGYNGRHPGNPYPVDKCYVYTFDGNLMARLEGVQTIHVYKVDREKLEAPVFIGDCVVTVLPALPEI